MLFVLLLVASDKPQTPSALMPAYDWRPIATCQNGVVLARLPIHPGRLALFQDLGCRVDYLDFDGRAAWIKPVTTPRFTTQKVAHFAVPLEWESGARGVGLCGAWGCLELFVPVEEVPYPESKITVSKQFMAPSAEQEKKIAKDRIHIAHAWTLGADDEQLWRWPWTLPRPPDYTSVFGAKRVINDKTHTRHLGTDFDGKTGEPIIAANDGLVILAEDLFYSGGSVFISHGLGVYTTYFHMSKIIAKPGDYVKAGDLIGLIGRTGRVTGPHLHFSAKLFGHYFEPMELFEWELSEID